MKTLLLSIAAFAVATAPVFGEDQNDQYKQKQRKQDAPKPPQKQVNNVPRSYTPQVQQKLHNQTQALQNKPNFNRQNYAPKTYTPAVQPRTVVPVDTEARVNPNTRQSTENKWNQNNNNNWNRNRPNTDVVTNQTNTSVQTTTTNNTVRNRNWQNNNYNNTDTNRNWQNNHNRNWNNNNSSTFTFEQARRNHHRERHHRDWWRSHYSRIALFAGGYYYWNSGYWYPAYGYDPYYSNYTYDEPIYGYNDLQPGEVIVHVQTALQEQGYYDDAVDGLIGPRTRAALTNFQRDRGLPVTAAIDGPTLQALGLD
jgi:Putative peptidoglycan binding domain